jgi:hypothetical protein
MDKYPAQRQIRSLADDISGAASGVVGGGNLGHDTNGILLYTCSSSGAPPTSATAIQCHLMSATGGTFTVDLIIGNANESYTQVLPIKIFGVTANASSMGANKGIVGLY